MSENSDTPTPDQRADKPNFLTSTRFDGFEVQTEILDGLTKAGFSHCTPIQAQTLPVSLTGRDVAGQAQTGTGKTAAFLVTIFTRLLSLADRDPKLPSALIVAPTRELARQIYDEAMLLGRHTGLSMVQIVGGVDYGKQADSLRRGVDIVICTPGRIIDYFKQGIFKTKGVKIVVIDEADRLLDLGFAKDMQFILRKLPHFQKRQSMLFSATLSYRVMELTYEYMNLPEFIAVTPEEVTVEGIEQVLFHVGAEKKLPLLLGLLAKEDWQRLLIFVNTKAGVEWLSKKLKGNQWPAEGITGDLEQKKRFSLMERFKNGNIKILLATDVASRGIHVEDIGLVINYDLPQDAENYIHRIGRTARAGKTGRAVSLACEKYVFHLEAIEELLGQKIPVQWPQDDMYVEDRSGNISLARKSKKGKPPQRHGRERTGRAGRRPQLPKPTTPRSFPGAFFGFGPPQAEPTPSTGSLSEPAPTSENGPKADSKATEPAATRPASSPPVGTAQKPQGTETQKRRRSRKKRSARTPAGKSTDRQSITAESPERVEAPNRRHSRKKKSAPITPEVPVEEQVTPTPTAVAESSSDGTAPPKRTRSRTPKSKTKAAGPTIDEQAATTPGAVAEPAADEVAAPKRGRTRKKKSVPTPEKMAGDKPAEESSAAAVDSPDGNKVPKRGRTRKKESAPAPPVTTVDKQKAEMPADDAGATEGAEAPKRKRTPKKKGTPAPSTTTVDKHKGEKPADNADATEGVEAPKRKRIRKKKSAPAPSATTVDKQKAEMPADNADATEGVEAPKPKRTRKKKSAPAPSTATVDKQKAEMPADDAGEGAEAPKPKRTRKKKSAPAPAATAVDKQKAEMSADDADAVEGAEAPKPKRTRKKKSTPTSETTAVDQPAATTSAAAADTPDESEAPKRKRTRKKKSAPTAVDQD